MADKNIVQMRDRQRRVFRIATDPQRFGLTLKMIATDAGLDYDSLRNYASGQTTMPITALFALVGVVADELLSLLLPEGRQIVQAPEELDHEKLTELAQDYLQEMAQSRRENSECGPAIGPNEHLRLVSKAVQLKVAA